MKLLLFLITFFPSLSFAQQRFEGRIKYSIKLTGEEQEGNLVALFGPKAIKLIISEGKKSDREEFLILPDSGLVYILNTENKTYLLMHLAKGTSSPIELSPRTFDGFSAKAIELSTLPLHRALTESMVRGKYYLADSLFYEIPEEYAGNTEFLMIANGRIVLGAEFESVRDAGQWNLNYEIFGTNIISFKAEATSIRKEKIDENEFRIPKDYKEDSFFYSQPSSDSTFPVEDFPLLKEEQPETLESEKEQGGNKKLKSNEKEKARKQD